MSFMVTLVNTLNGGGIKEYNMKESIDYNEFLKELKEQYGRCEKLFNIAWDINNNKDTKYNINDFPKMVLSDMSAVTQTLGFLIDRYNNEIKA